jgi:drug/metabolite transporter (DMT)-like permease
MRLNKKWEVINMFALYLVMICIICGAIGQILMKAGMIQISEIKSIEGFININTLFCILTNVYVFSGLLLYAISAILWLGALSTLDVSYMYPLLSLAYVITAILAFVLLKESITLLRWVGIAFVVVGCFMISET